MGGRYVKAYRTTKLASGMDHFLDEDELDAILAIMDADMFENNKDIESEIVMCIKKLSSRENCLFKWEFCPKVYQSKASLSRHKKLKHQILTTLDSVSHGDSGGLKSRLELTGFSLIYQNAQKLSKDLWYPESVMEVLKNFSTSVDNFLPFYYCHDLVLAFGYTFSAFLFVLVIAWFQVQLTVNLTSGN